MKGLTAKQQAIHDLRSEGKGTAEIARLLGISGPVVRKTVVVINRKLGISFSKEEALVRRVEAAAAAHLIENKAPVRAAAILDALTEVEPYQKIKEAFAACGLPKAPSEALIHRLRVKYAGPMEVVRALKTAEILDLLNKRVHLGLLYLDDKVMAEASARDLMLGISSMIEKRQLLRGEPTQIIADADRRKLNELLPALIEEGRRRGITIPGVATRVANSEAQS